MSVYLPRGANYWWYKFDYKKETYHQSSGCKNERDAKKVETVKRIEVAAEYAKNALAMGRHPTRPKNFTIEQACSIYFNAKGYGATNADYDLQNMQLISERLRPEKLITEITGGDIQRLINERKKDGVAPSTINRTVTELLKRVLNWASEQEMVSGLPKIRWKSLKLKEDCPRERVLSDAELDSLRSHMTGDGYGAAFEFALMTGLRLENFSELRWDQIDFDETSIPIRQKGDKPHKVELTPSVRALLESQKGNHPEFVFAYIVNRTAKNPKNPGVVYEKGARMPVTYWGFRSWFQRVTKAAGIKNVRVHDLRKTAGSHMLNVSGNLVSAQKLLGHSSPETTARAYAFLEQKTLVADMEKVQAQKSSKNRQSLTKTATPSG